MNIKCSNCNHINSPDRNFCGKCGEPITAPGQTITDSPGTQPIQNQPAAKNKGNLITVLIILGVLVGVCGLCGIAGMINSSSTPKTVVEKSGDSQDEKKPEDPPRIEVLFSIPELANQTVAEAETVIGKASEVEPVKDEKDEMPGEYRIYKFEGKGSLTIRYFKGKVANVFFVGFGTWSGDDLLALTGFGDANLTQIESTDDFTKWTGTVSGVEFSQILANPSMKPNGLPTLTVDVLDEKESKNRAATQQLEANNLADIRAKTELNDETSKDAPVINLYELAGKTQSEVRAILGKPTETTTLNKTDNTGDISWDYNIEQEFFVNFKNGKANYFHLKTKTPFPTAWTLAKAFGIDLVDATPGQSSTAQISFSGKVGSKNFSNIRMINDTSGYVILTVHVQ